MVVLVSWDAAYTFRDRIVVAPITSTIRGLDAEVLLDVIATVLRSTLRERVTQLSDVRLAQIDRAIHLALGMRLPCRVS